MKKGRDEVRNWFQRQIRVRMLRMGINAATVCKKVRRPVNWLTRKIHPGVSEAREITLGDVQEIAEGMGVPWLELFTHPIPEAEAAAEDPYAT